MKKGCFFWGEGPVEHSDQSAYLAAAPRPEAVDLLGAVNVLDAANGMRRIPKGCVPFGSILKLPSFKTKCVFTHDPKFMLIGNGHCADSSENPTQQSVQQVISLGKLLKQHSFGKTRENHLLAQSHLLEPHLNKWQSPLNPWHGHLTSFIKPVHKNGSLSTELKSD